MNVRIVRACVMLGLACILTSSALAATESVVLNANIPFEFRVMDRLLPEGRYTFSIDSNGILRVADADGEGLAAGMTVPIRDEPSSSAALVVFTRLGDEHLLSELQWSHGGTRRELLRPRAEGELFASKAGKHAMVAVVARTGGAVEG